jgi:quercetin dioxygenase-like cupin family protein
VLIDGVSHDLEAGENIIMPAHVRHALHASEKFKMVLTMIKSQ